MLSRDTGGEAIAAAAHTEGGLISLIAPHHRGDTPGAWVSLHLGSDLMSSISPQNQLTNSLMKVSLLLHPVCVYVLSFPLLSAHPLPLLISMSNYIHHFVSPQINSTLLIVACSVIKPWHFLEWERFCRNITEVRVMKERKQLTQLVFYYFLF